MTFKALALTFSGITDLCAAEIKHLIGVPGKQTEEGVVFETITLEDIFTVCYRAQSVSRVLLLLSEGTIDKLSVPKEYLSGTLSFTGKTTTKAQELAERIVAQKVYKNADTPLYLHFENEHCWLGVDLTEDISKRDYRIFVGSETLKGGTAFAALMLAGYEPKHILLDPNCRAGSITIEAALHALQLPVRNYSKEKMPFGRRFKEIDTEKFFVAEDKKAKESISGTIIAISEQFPAVQAARKNAKIAGVGKTIDFSRTALDWLDIKFEKQSIDRIVTQPIEFTMTFPPEKAKKFASLFFERASAVLKKNGAICIVLRQGAEQYKTAAKAHGFSATEERTVMQGKETWQMLLFARS